MCVPLLKVAHHLKRQKNKNKMEDPNTIPEPLSLYDKIMIIYPELTFEDFMIDKNGYVVMKDDGEGAYIYSWTHPIFPRPTQEQFDNVVSP